MNTSTGALHTETERPAATHRFLMLYSVKPAFVRSLSGVRALLARRGVSANQVSMAAVPVSAAAAGMVVLGSWIPLAWLAVLPLCGVWMALNALDGSLARETGRVTHRGAFLNEVADRAGDLFLLAAGFWVLPLPVAGAAAASIVTMELVGALGWAITGERVLDGPMAKPDRAIAIGSGAAVATFAAVALPVAYAVVAVGAGFGAVVRARRVWAAGGANEAADGES